MHALGSDSGVLEPYMSLLYDIIGLNDKNIALKALIYLALKIP